MYAKNNKKYNNIKLKAPVYTCKKGSLTLEAAVIIPFVAAFLVSILFFFRVLQVQTAVQESLTYSARKSAATSVVTEKSAVNLSMAKGYYFSHVSRYQAARKYIDGTWVATSFAGSDCSQEYIDLKVNYDVKLPVSFFNIKKVTVYQGIKQRRWVGDKPHKKSEDEDPYVYITKTGYAYHSTSSCSHIDLGISQITKSQLESARNQSGGKYHRCSKCGKKVKNANVFYIADYGTTYHTDINCSGLKRSVSKVRLSEVGNRTPCKHCYSE